jgi:hypothetical protein
MVQRARAADLSKAMVSVLEAGIAILKEETWTPVGPAKQNTSQPSGSSMR